MRIVKPISITDSNLLSSSVVENDYPAYSSTTSYTAGQRVIVPSLHKVYESLRGASSTVTISQASPTVVGWAAHGLPAGSKVTFTSTGTLPTGITAGTIYYVINPQTNTFNISASLGGSAINTTSSGSGTFTATESPNLNNTPATSPTYWLDCGSTNRWKAFDKSVQSQTTAPTTFSFSVFMSGYVDTIPLLNITGATSARVQVTHGDDGTVYDETAQLITNDQPVVDLASYLFSGFKIRKDIIFENIPPFYGTTITVTLTGPVGTTVGLGCAIFGAARDISSTGLGVEQGARIGIDDYSVKTIDSFGNYTILERAFAKRANFTVYVNRDEVDSACSLLTEVRATPIVVIGSRTYESTIIYGFVKNWECEIAYRDCSVFTLEMAGLT